jgi:enoyl-CoA hydratase/carnithine racemase
MTVLLPQAVGLRRAIEMWLTGNYLTAAEALQAGLVNHVVPPSWLTFEGSCVTRRADLLVL